MSRGNLSLQSAQETLRSLPAHVQPGSSAALSGGGWEASASGPAAAGMPPAAGPSPAAAWGLDTFRGRFAELSGGAATAALTLAFRLVLEAQRRAEPVAWVTHPGGTFFPPDAAAGGVDLEALAVIRVASLERAPRAAELLLRSGGFGLVVLDLGRVLQLPLSVQTRLAGLTRKHHAALIALTEKDSELPSLGPLVSLRLEAERAAKVGDRFACRARVLKDKRRGEPWSHQELCRGPSGLY